MRSDSIREDIRAVEGMPIRLVVAVAVGAAALSLLVPMLDTVEPDGPEELVVEPDRQQLLLDEKSQNITIAVVTGEGKPVEGSTVVLTGHSLPLSDGPHTVETGPDSHRATVSIGTAAAADLTVEFRATQRRGTIEVGVVPPGGGFREASEQPEITVTRSG